ncbi:TauD/TfdA family dioxygenase [Pseudoalteromonas sp. MMG007]|uniref:TauD/TfdA family dioxygenase n=1 Tax=Pseudoalteromonas sp. MMG007 TaxID=2822684 RepID=UPI001B377BD3|nr:TauD/TfdA family dioxygenase [Pseudoalteromonas sp. MMG007]MBQ4860002.1 TauD/TfdA family dioxygenase [Pseudoalteromonas sp. MMG007]
MKFNNWKNIKSESIVERKLKTGLLPLTYRAEENVSTLQTWFAENQTSLFQELTRFGAILFRGFSVNSTDAFEDVVNVALEKTSQYVEGATPRTSVSRSVYTSTEFPPSEEIALHNELSYTVVPPSKILFYCNESNCQGGETPIADVRKVLKYIDPEIIDEFSRRGGYRLVRNFGASLGPSVEKVFGTTDRKRIFTYCEEADIKIESFEHDKMVTSQVRPAVHKHPTTGELLWFNHVAFWHSSSLPTNYREMMEKSLGADGLPFLTRFADDSLIPESYIANIRQAYCNAEQLFTWKPGDVLLLDNWLVAHGRKAFNGTRKVFVAMG